MKKASVLSKNKVHAGVHVGNTAHMEFQLGADVERVRALQQPHEVFVMRAEGIVPHVVGEKTAQAHFKEHATLKLYPAPIPEGEDPAHHPSAEKRGGKAVLDMMYTVTIHKNRKEHPRIIEGTWTPVEEPGAPYSGRCVDLKFEKKQSFYSVRKGYIPAEDRLNLKHVNLSLWEAKSLPGKGLFGRDL